MRRSSFENVVRLAVHLSLVAECPSTRGTMAPVARNCECGHVLRATLVVVKRALIPILYLWIIAKLRQTQGANPRDVFPAHLQAFSHDVFGHLVLPVGLPHAQPILSLPPRKPSGRRLERRWPLAPDQAFTAIVDHQLLEFLTQEASRETRQAFRLPATAGFSLAPFPIG